MITVLDDGAGRPDLAVRRELKFVFQDSEVASLRRLLESSCRPIRYAGPVSTVRSIYFDDPRMRDCYANYDGVGARQKTRLRWYDRETPTDRFFVEVKWRRHRACGKHRALVTAVDSLGEMPYRSLLRALRRDLPAPYQERLARDAEPIVMVEYRREHFALRDGAGRLTLDYDLRFYPQRGRARFGRRFGASLPGVTIVELKTAADDERPIPRLLAPLKPREARFSKYVCGSQILGYVKESQA